MCVGGLSYEDQVSTILTYHLRDQGAGDGDLLDSGGRWEGEKEGGRERGKEGRRREQESGRKGGGSITAMK